MTDADKLNFARQATSRMATFTRPYIASVTGIVSTDLGAHVGSALRYAPGPGRHAIVTALHVVRQATDVPYVGMAVSSGHGRVPAAADGPMWFDAAGDVAVLSLPVGEVAGTDGLSADVWPQSRIELRPSDRLATDYLFVHGFPAAQSRFSPLAGGVVSRSLPYGAVRRLDRLPADLKPFQFAIDFDPNRMSFGNGSAAGLVDPHGLSGSPVWRLGLRGQGADQWSPEQSRVIGFITQWRERDRLLIGTFAGSLLARPLEC